MLFLQVAPEVATQTVPVILQWGLAGALLIVLLYVFHVIWKDFKQQRELTQKELKDQRESFQKEIEAYKVANKELADQLIQQTEKYAQSILANDRDNIASINDVTNSLNNLALLIRELQNKF